MEKFKVKNTEIKSKNQESQKLLPKKKKINSLIANINNSSDNNENVAERVKGGMDRMFLILVLILLCIGTIFVFSSSYVYAKSKFDDSYHFAKKQIVFATVSILIMYVVSKIDYLIIKAWSYRFFILSYLSLWAVFLWGADANGARRWIYIGGFSVQTSEIVKLGVVLAMSKYIVNVTQKNVDNMRTFKRGVLPFGIVLGLIVFALYLQPHLSAIVIIAATMFIMMYIGGARKDILLWLMGIGTVGLGAIFLGTSHGRARIEAFLHPENDLKGDGWQPLQSLYAIGSGGLWGTGLGQSKQKHLYLPEPQNDYIFSIICEEMGFVFAVAVIGIFLLLLWRGYHIAKEAPSKYSSLVVMGIITKVGLQIFLNIAVVTKFIPSTGVSLPFFSYGGSSLWILMLEMGIILGISRYSYIEKK